MTVEIVYCEGWDPRTRSIVGPLPEAAARERDAAGEQYAVVFTGERPRVLVEVCWAAHHAAVWHLDAQGRRDRRLVFRRWPGDRLVLLTAEQWAYQPGSREFHRGEPSWRVPFWRARYQPDGSRTVSAGNWEGPGLEVPSVHPVPDVGGWGLVVGERGPVVIRDDPPAGDPVEPPWRPPVPCRPRQLDATLSEGARFALDDGSEVSVELAGGGMLSLPTGRLVVADPDPWMHEQKPFVETVEPGEYPLRVSVIRFADTPGHTRVAACALWVSDRPTASWNNAWREGEHPLLLGEGEFYGVGVDSGRVALVDASVAREFEDTIEDAYARMTGPAHVLAAPSGANLITVEAGWGDGAYPVWVGRDDEGRLTCFVVDFLVLAHATPLD